MLKSVPFAIAFLVSVFIGNAQSLEFGVIGGVCNYMGDLSDFKLRNDQYQPAGGMMIRFSPDRYVTLKGSFLYGTIGGADSLSNKAEHRRRNLSFKSTIYDFTVQAEWNLAGFCFGDYNKKYAFSPYAGVGISVFKFNPQAHYKGKWYELQPLKTEGQGTTLFQDRRTYALTQFAMPLSLGFKWRWTDYVNFGMELSYRVTFTDYLDDVSSTYVDPDYLRQNTSGDNPAAELSDRSGEVNNGMNVGLDADGKGLMRGNKNTPTDFFMFMTANICYRFPLPGVKCTNF